MATKKIYYANLLNISCELVRQSEITDKKYVYSTCPVVNHKDNRTFVGISPIDFDIRVDVEKKIIYCSDENFIFCDNEHIESPTPVIQLLFPRFLFWTDEKNVWFEFNDYPLTSYKNNFIAIGGWFNLSNWVRNMSLAVRFVDKEKKIIIKKGDPLFRVTFHSQNLNDGILLREEKNPKIIEKKLKEMEMNKNIFFNNTLANKLFSNSNVKKCPFRFLFK